MMNGYFDTKKFMAKIDQVRQKRNLTWRQVSIETGVNYSVINQLKSPQYEGKGMHANTMATLSLWGNINPVPFMKKYS